MELPTDKEHDEQVVRIPEPFKVGATPLLESEIHHDEESCCHYPTSRTWAGEEVGCKERDDALASGLSVWIDHGKLGKIDHVCTDVNHGSDNNRPCSSLVECDVLVKRNDIVKRTATKNRDEVPANGEEDEDDIDVKDQSRSTSDR